VGRLGVGIRRTGDTVARGLRPGGGRIDLGVRGSELRLRERRRHRRGRGRRGRERRFGRGLRGAERPDGSGGSVGLRRRVDDGAAVLRLRRVHRQHQAEPSPAVDTETWFWPVEAVDWDARDSSTAESVDTRVAEVTYNWPIFWNCTLVCTSAVSRIDRAALSSADLVALTKLGMAMASRTARTNSATMNSTRVRPLSAPVAAMSMRAS